MFPDFVVAMLDLLLGVVWVVAWVRHNRKIGFMLLTTGSFAAAVVFLSYRIFINTAYLNMHGFDPQRAREIGMLGLVFLSVRTVCYALMITGASLLAFGSREKVAEQPPIK